MRADCETVCGTYRSPNLRLHGGGWLLAVFCKMAWVFYVFHSKRYKWHKATQKFLTRKQVFLALKIVLSRQMRLLQHKASYAVRPSVFVAIRGLLSVYMLFSQRCYTVKALMAAASTYYKHIKNLFVSKGFSL